MLIIVDCALCGVLVVLTTLTVELTTFDIVLTKPISVLTTLGSFLSTTEVTLTTSRLDDLLAVRLRNFIKHRPANFPTPHHTKQITFTRVTPSYCGQKSPSYWFQSKHRGVVQTNEPAAMLALQRVSYYFDKRSIDARPLHQHTLNQSENDHRAAAAHTATRRWLPHSTP